MVSDEVELPAGSMAFRMPSNEKESIDGRARSSESSSFALRSGLVMWFIAGGG